MKVLNIWGGPGTGKSTTAAGLFHHMKSAGIECELIQEYAKDMVWEHRQNILEDQIYIFAKQQRRIFRLRDHNMEWVITDSPIPLGLCYMKQEHANDAFTQVVMQVFNSYQNYNFYLTRNVEYNPNGRNQKHVSDAQDIDSKLTNMLIQNHITCDMIKGGEHAVRDILACLQIVK